MRWEVPEGWAWATAGDLADVVGGSTPAASNPDNFEEGGIPWITPADLTGYQETYISRGARSLSKPGYSGSGAQLMPAGTVLFTSRAPIGYCAIAANEIATNQGFKSLVLGPGIVPEFIRYYLLSSKSYAESQASGTTFLELSGSRMKELAIPFCPTSEQRRIVAKLDELRARSRRAREALDEVPALLEKLKQSILAAAFRGDLTAEWRAKNPDVEPASVLLERIRAERRRRWEEANPRKKYVEPEPVDTEGLPELAEGWCWAPLDAAMSKIVDGTHHTPEYVDEGVAFISVKDIRDGKLHFGDCKFIRPEAHAELARRCNPELGDILVTKSGTIGRTAVIEMERPFSLFVSVALLKPASTEVKGVWFSRAIENWMSSVNVANDIKGSSIKNLHLTDFRQLAFPLAPKDEQAVVIDRITQAIARLNSLKLRLGSLRDHVTQLDQSILAKAFRGELVPQDPIDEPAEKLLERIRAARAQETDNVPKKRGRKLAKV